MSVICVDDLAEQARALVAPEVWDYIDGGAGAERTLRANRTAFEGVRLRPRMLVDVSTCDTSTTLLGASLRSPIGVAPVAYHRLVHEEGETATVRGAAGALCMVSFFSSRTIEEIAAEATGPLWLQLYWLRERATLVSLIGRAEAAGYGAIVLTADTPRVGRRLRDMRNGFALDPAIRAANLDDALTTQSYQRQAGQSAIATHAARTFDPSLTWADLEWLRGVTKLPIVVKGILTAEDAARAVESGVDALIVSNHGGRQLDGAPATLHALVEVSAAVHGACPVIMDGGVRGGGDVFAALALGADAVLIGRPVLWALAVAGAEGVGELLELLEEELTHTMALAGRPTLAAIDRSAVELGGGELARGG
jgi:4-hydroxymandelate oxidase